MQPLKTRNGLVIPFHTLRADNYLSMLGLKLNHVSKRGYWSPPPLPHIDTQAFNLEPSALIRVIFAGEFRSSLYRSDGRARVRRRVGERQVLHLSNRWNSQTLHVAGTSELVVVDGTVSHQRFNNILCQSLIPSDWTPIQRSLVTTSHPILHWTHAIFWKGRGWGYGVTWPEPWS